ncbi:MAG: chromosomal replication initiator protein DnaA [Mogibacterium sp.]|nr:chromosomal replication initiator protein DnaA [Mogibacterium sp.]
MDHNKIWDEFLAFIRANTTEVSYNTWFTTLYIYRMDETVDIIYLAARDKIKVSHIQNRYMHLIEQGFETVLGRKFRVIVRFENDYKEEEKPRTRTKKSIEDNSKLFVPRLNFDNFVVGENNKLAHAAALAVAEAPGESYNPLFIYGGSGLGKTHLMQAIGIYIIKNNPATSVLYVSSEMFTNELVKAISENKMRSFKNKYRKVDVLLIDDIQFLENKDKTQEEFFHTFNALHEDSKQIVISSDRPPSSLVNLEERLRSRFAMNLIVDISPADFETRVAILRKKAENLKEEKPELNLEWNDDLYEVCCLIAEKFTDNIRELEGTFNNIVNYSDLLGEEINVPFARRMLKNIIKDSDQEIAPERIRSIVAKHYKIKVADMDSGKRNAEIALPRQVAMYLCRECTDLSLPKIGKIFGDKHYSTVIHSVNKISELYAKDELFRKDLDEIRGKIKEKK